MTEAQALRLVTDGQLTEAAKTSSALRALLHDGPRLTGSEAERRLLSLIRKAGLPKPQTNTKVHGKNVDAYWPEHHLVMEVDGFAFHGHRQAFEQDRRTDRRLTNHGITVLRTTWRELTDAPERVVADLAGALRSG